MLTKDEVSSCPVANMVELIGNKAGLLIIRSLLAYMCRLGKFKRGIHVISQKVLADNLRKIGDDGLSNCS